MRGKQVRLFLTKDDLAEFEKALRSRVPATVFLGDRPKSPRPEILPTISELEYGIDQTNQRRRGWESALFSTIRKLIIALLEREGVLLHGESQRAFELNAPVERCRLRALDEAWRKGLNSVVLVECEGDTVILRYPTTPGGVRDEGGWRTDRISFHGRFFDEGTRTVFVGRFRSSWFEHGFTLFLFNAIAAISATIVVGRALSILLGREPLSYESITTFVLAGASPFWMLNLVQAQKPAFEREKVAFSNLLDYFVKELQRI